MVDVAQSLTGSGVDFGTERHQFPDLSLDRTIVLDSSLQFLQEQPIVNIGRDDVMLDVGNQLVDKFQMLQILLEMEY